MKVMTIVGTRPELIRLSRIIPLLDKYTEHVLVHTGQNYDPNLKDVFFQDMEIRKPDWEFCIHLNEDKSTFGQIAQILKNTETVIKEERPSKILILGDTNSGLSAIVAHRFDVPVYHMEAGNRCFSEIVPEELNRRIIDTSSSILMPYTERSRMNLLQEGYESDRIYVTGNPIGEVLNHFSNQINASNILHEFGVFPKKYFLMTMHRSENVDNPLNLTLLSQTIRALSARHPVIVSVHPHTRRNLEGVKFDFGDAEMTLPEKTTFPKNVYMHEPFGFFDFVHMEKNAACVLSDSGTVQEECAILGVPSCTLRRVTERPETIEYGSGMLTGCYPNDVLKGVDFATQNKAGGIPSRYMDLNVSTTVMKIILGVG